MNCGTGYSSTSSPYYVYHTFSYHIGVAHIILHFSHDKKQTLYGLLHDIITLSLKHCVDISDEDRTVMQFWADLFMIPFIEVMNGKKQRF